MKITVIGSTNSLKTKQDFLEFGRVAGRICYSKLDYEELFKEEDTANVLERLLNSGHHSVFDHGSLNLYLKGIPKFGAMILNNEKMYTTSEKSARFTLMKPVGKEKELYDKWMQKFEEIIGLEYPQLGKIKAQKLAQENARYMLSVFTPTRMLHTVSFRQLNYLMHWFNGFVRDAPGNRFNDRAKEFMCDFNEQMKDFYEERLVPDLKKRSLSIFSERQSYAEEFGENYSTTYYISFAGLAQEHRHRTLDYEIMQITDSFFVPPILFKYPNALLEWEDDGKAVAEEFPQGTLLRVHESGKYTDFISKMNERLCGQAQWEIMDQTRKTLADYIRETNISNPEVHAELVKYSDGPRCCWPETKCASQCEFTAKYGLERLV